MRSKYSIEHIARIFPDYKDYGNEVAISTCPNCHNENYKFWVNIVKGVGICYVCGYSPRLETLIGLAEFDDLAEVKKDNLKEIEPLPAMVPFYEMDLMHPLFGWLTERKLGATGLSDYGVMYCHKGKHWKRIIFPFFGPLGEYRGFQGRYISNDVPEKISKWTTARGTKKSQMLWNFDRVMAVQNWCVLTEGIFDALRLRDMSVAMLGKKPSNVQRELLEYFKHIFIMLDSDATEDAYKMAPELVEEAAFRVTVIPLLKGDPDEYEPDELVEKIIEFAPPGFDLFGG